MHFENVLLARFGFRKVWDIWRVEGTSFVWHFRGAPHVPAYINIGMAKC